MNFPKPPPSGNVSPISSQNFNIWAILITTLVILLPIIGVTVVELRGEPLVCPAARARYGTSAPAVYMHGGSSQTHAYVKACLEESKAR